MKVSVVIPAYNAAAYIEGTLERVKAQTFKDYEIVLVDDGSTDGTGDVAEHWLSRSGVQGRCIRQPNKKIAGARNTGLRNARAPYVALLDADDLWYPEKLEVMAPELDAHPEVDLVSHWERVIKDGREVRIARHGPESAATYESLLFNGNALSPSATLLRRDKALAIGGFRENPEFNTVEDYDFWMRFSRVAKMRFIPRVLGDYQLLPSGVTRKVVYHHDNTEALLRDHFAAFVDPNLWQRLRMRRRLAAVYRSALGELLSQPESAELRRHYVARMLEAFPLDPKNVFRALQWAVTP